MQLCSKCKIEQPLEFFSKNQYSCKSCNKNYRLNNKEKIKEYQKQYALNNRNKLKVYKKEYNLNNKEKIKEEKKQYYSKNKEQAKIYCLNNREKINTRNKKYNKERYKTDINYKLACASRARLNHAIKNNQKAGSAVKDLGCTIEELIIHLEKQFTEGMSWDKWGYGKDKINIDHIKPLASFDLTKREELLEAVHYTNLQPLWQIDNFKKHDKC